ncbi:MAG: adenosylmethionine decarboxylase [Patescibacteria group bacterium]|nr:adenosylmethionine decarboxylase [Patescibacteria group bacterium]
MNRKNKINNLSVYGKHLIIDAYNIQREQLKNTKEIRKLFIELIKNLKMRPLSSPIVKKITSPSYSNWGLSGFVMLYESHISIHTWPENGYAAMDIYSCKDFDEQKVIKLLKTAWKRTKIKTRILMRN